jgi:hypothetical protein
MNSKFWRLLVGILLVLAGVIFLIQQIFDLPIGGLIIAMFFAVAGGTFVYVVIRDHKNWWAVIPGFTLLGLAALIASGDLFPAFSNRFGGSLFLGSIALSFIAIVLIKPSNWWAVIPAGVLTTLALVAGMRGGHGMAQGGLFFLGIGATFAALGLLPVGQKEKWPWIPAAICLILGTLIMVGSGALVDSVFGWVWAAAFLGVGLFLIIRSIVKKQ